MGGCEGCEGWEVNDDRNDRWRKGINGGTALVSSQKVPDIRASLKSLFPTEIGQLDPC